MAAKSSEKDRMMSANLKANGVVRSTARCPVCNRVQSVDVIDGSGLYGHIVFRCVKGSNKDD